MSKNILSLVLCCSAATAQAPAAQITGVVKDAAGAVIAGAEVKATQTATGAVHMAASGTAGEYTLADLPPGSYSLEVSKEGFGKFALNEVVVRQDAPSTVNVLLQTPPATGAPPSLKDLGFTPTDTQGTAQDQARLDRRSHMLQIHQRLGLITLAPLVATLITSSGAKGGRNSTASSSASGRELHAALGGTTAGLYLTTAAFAIFAPKVPNTKTRGPILVHKALAFIHGPGMILTPILGAMAFNQRAAGEKVHGIASAHGAVAAITGIAYGAAILSVTIKF
jgi:hypothetical protein